jgi:Zn ribbon nucleic-acid-binding protein
MYCLSCWWLDYLYDWQKKAEEAKMTCIECGHSKKQKQYKTTGKFHDITIDCNCSCHKKN